MERSRIPVESQGIIEIQGLKKTIDLVSPSSSHYLINPKQIVLISCKTTLRERWKEVIEEVRGIKESKVFLISLDEQFTEHLLEACKQTQTNIQLVVLDTVKKNYSEHKHIISLEELLKICKENSLYWTKK